MANFYELTRDYGLKYAILAFFEYRAPWTVKKWLMGKMNLMLKEKGVSD